jgi:SAM-dependent methyltransferase
MSITVISGLPGSGKSAMLIEAVHAAREQGRPVATFACSDSAWLRANDMISARRLLASRRPGLTCPLDHFVSTDECATILGEIPPGTLAAFEEADAFALNIVPHWIEASLRDVEVLVAHPSDSQIEHLDGKEFEETLLVMRCQRCQIADANTFVWLQDPGKTISTCANCHLEMQRAARRQILELLGQPASCLGEGELHQPVELEELSDWTVVRSDSRRRAEIMARVIREADLPRNGPRGRRTYLDVGCNTGYFCHALRRGFQVEGVDENERDVRVARLLESFFRKDFAKYAATDLYTYLRDTQERLFDVTSALSVFEPMIVESLDRGVACLEWLFAKTNRLCFLEMDYSGGPRGDGIPPPDSDRPWVQRIMEERGRFTEVRVFEAG